MSASLKRHLQTLLSFELDALRLDRWNEVSSLAEKFSADVNMVRQLLAELKPRQRADRFEWLQAVCKRHDIGVRGLRAAIALFSFAGESGYLWPSQKSLASRAGYADEAEVRRGLTSLVDIGALRKVKVVNLPEDLAEKALTSAKEGGSGRSARGTAYALVPPDCWSEKSPTGTPCPSTNRDTVSLLNLQYKPPQASPGFFSHIGDSSPTSPLAEPFVLGTDEGKKGHG